MNQGMTLSTEERFAAALERLADLSEIQTKAYVDLASSMVRLTASIQGAQKKISNEFVPAINQSKAAHAAMLVEADRARRSRATE